MQVRRDAYSTYPKPAQMRLLVVRSAGGTAGVLLRHGRHVLAVQG